MAGYGQFCPVARGAEVFAQRWTPLVVRELLKGNHHFNELRRGLPRIPKAVLAKRLVELGRAGIVEIRTAPKGRGHEYYLTACGAELAPVVDALGTWAYKWVSRELRPEHLDPGLLMWFLRRRVRVENLPAGRVVVRFEFRGLPRQRYWLVLERPDVDICYQDPGFEVDLCVIADVEALTRVYLGHIELTYALREGLVETVGPPDLCRGLRDWMGITPFARPVERVHA